MDSTYQAVVECHGCGVESTRACLTKSKNRQGRALMEVTVRAGATIGGAVRPDVKRKEEESLKH